MAFTHRLESQVDFEVDFEVNFSSIIHCKVQSTFKLNSSGIKLLINSIW